MHRASLLLIAALALTPSAAATSPPPAPEPPTVGMPARIDQLVLPGSELETKPITDRRAKVVVRIAAVYPHGTAHRYDLVYYGLEPGGYDLRDSLRRKDGTPTADLPPIPVTVRAILPPGQVEPHALTPTPAFFLSGYRLIMLGLGFAWVIGLVLILVVGRKRRTSTPGTAAGPPSMADRLRPLVEAARGGTLAEGQAAELERLLIEFWRRRLGLEALPPARAIAAIRADDHAGALLRHLEAWLHQPPGSAAPVDVAALLEPYRRLAPGVDRPVAAVGGVAG